MILGAPLGPVSRVWPGQFAAALGAHAATVDDPIPGCGRGFRTGADHPNERDMHAAQEGRAAPFHQAPPQRRAADPIPRGTQFPPLHALAQKEPQRFDHRLGGAARTTLIAARSFNPIDQIGHQAACRRSHLTSPVSIAREGWARPPSLTAALKAAGSSSAAPHTSENRALFIWARFLGQVSRIELRLIPMHPDRAAGLGFLSNAACAIALLAVAHGALLAGRPANRWKNC